MKFSGGFFLLKIDLEDKNISKNYLKYYYSVITVIKFIKKRFFLY